MAYQTISVGDVVARIMRLKGLNPTLGMAVMDDKQRGQYTDAVNLALEDIWSDKFWKDIMRFEPRTFRPPWDVTVAYAAGNQVYRQNPAWVEGLATEEKDGYFQAVIANNGVEPWGDSGTTWTQTDTATSKMAKYVEFIQPWEANAIDEVEFPMCAVSDDPRYKTWGDLTWIVGTVPMFDTPGILFPQRLTINQPWVRFRPKTPKFTLVPWVAGTSYSAGALVYDDPDTYVALVPSQGEQPSNSNGYWKVVGFPELFNNYVSFAGAAMITNETLGSYRSNPAVVEELARLRLRYVDRPGVQSKARWQSACGNRGAW